MNIQSIGYWSNLRPQTGEIGNPEVVHLRTVNTFDPFEPAIQHCFLAATKVGEMGQVVRNGTVPTASAEYIFDFVVCVLGYVEGKL